MPINQKKLAGILFLKFILITLVTVDTTAAPTLYIVSQ